MESFQISSLQPYFYMQPPSNDREAKNLIRSILHHRIRSIQAEKGEEAVIPVLEEALSLRKRYEALKGLMDRWLWPVSLGRTTYDETTKIPECDTPYVPESEGGAQYVTPIWNSFVTNLQVVKKFDGDDNGAFRGEDGRTQERETPSLPRLPIFKAFRQGQSLAGDWAKLPHINNRYGGAEPASATSEGVWRDLLLPTDQNAGSSQWNCIRDHYTGHHHHHHIQDDNTTASTRSLSPESLDSTHSSFGFGGGSGGAGFRDQSLPLSSCGERRESTFDRAMSLSRSASP